MVEKIFDGDCICWIKVAEELIVDGILERWNKIKPVIMEARKNLFFSVCKK